MKNEDKVYCKNCEYHDNENHSDIHRCWRFQKLDPIGYATDFEDCFKVNYDYQCSNYKPATKMNLYNYPDRLMV